MTARRFDISKFEGMPFRPYANIRDLEAAAPETAIIELSHPRSPLHIYYKDRGFSSTLVYFAAALPREGWDTYPVFGGTSFIKSHSANILSISDPSFALPASPPTGWTLGTSDFPLIDVIPRIIRHYCPDESSIILFGSSAGGYSALIYGSQLPKSVTVCANPRVDLMQLPTTLPTLLRETFPAATVWNAHDYIPTSAAMAYREAPGNTVAYIQNVHDRHYFNGGLLHFLGLNSNNARVFLKLIDSGLGHRVPSTDVLHGVVRQLTSHSPDWGGALNNALFTQAPTVDYAIQAREEMQKSAH